MKAVVAASGAVWVLCL